MFPKGNYLEMGTHDESPSGCLMGATHGLVDSSGVDRSLYNNGNQDPQSRICQERLAKSSFAPLLLPPFGLSLVTIGKEKRAPSTNRELLFTTSFKLKGGLLQLLA